MILTELYQYQLFAIFYLDVQQLYKQAYAACNTL